MSTSTPLKSLSVAAICAVAVGLGANKPADASTLWYNGDFNFVNGRANEINTLVNEASTYDDFIVPVGEIWNVDTIWSNNLINFSGVTQATWSILTGVSAGNGGTVIASGTSTATQTLTGRSGFGFDEYKIEVSGLDINLNEGTYWLSVTPIGFGSGRSFNSTTSGSNAIGLPAGNNNNSFLDSTFFGFNFGPQSEDYSMGVAGTIVTPVPEPASMLSLLAIGTLSAASLKRKGKDS